MRIYQLQQLYHSHSWSYGCFFHVFFLFPLYFFAKNRILNIRKILQIFFVYNTICFVYLSAETKDCIHIKRIESFISMKMEKKRKIFKQKKFSIFYFYMVLHMDMVNCKELLSKCNFVKKILPAQ